MCNNKKTKVQHGRTILGSAVRLVTLCLHVRGLSSTLLVALMRIWSPKLNRRSRNSEFSVNKPRTTHLYKRYSNSHKKVWHSLVSSLCKISFHLLYRDNCSSESYKCEFHIQKCVLLNSNVLCGKIAVQSKYIVVMLQPSFSNTSKGQPVSGGRVLNLIVARGLMLVKFRAAIFFRKNGFMVFFSLAWLQKNRFMEEFSYQI